MIALKVCLESDRIKTDPERQLRLSTGTLYDDEDFRKAYQETAPVYTPPQSALFNDNFGGLTLASFEGDESAQAGPALQHRMRHSAILCLAMTFVQN